MKKIWEAIKKFFTDEIPGETDPSAAALLSNQSDAVALGAAARAVHERDRKA